MPGRRRYLVQAGTLAMTIPRAIDPTPPTASVSHGLSAAQRPTVTSHGPSPVGFGFACPSFRWTDRVRPGFAAGRRGAEHGGAT